MAELFDIEVVGYDVTEGGFSLSSAPVMSILTSSVSSVEQVIGDYREYHYLLLGNYGTSLLAASKPSYYNTSPTVVYPISTVVPGPIANISYGIRVGRDLERIEVPRVYPAIYINPRSRNA